MLSPNLIDLISDDILVIKVLVRRLSSWEIYHGTGLSLRGLWLVSVLSLDPGLRLEPSLVVGVSPLLLRIEQNLLIKLPLIIINLDELLACIV
jgi:hypothetical protein